MKRIFIRVYEDFVIPLDAIEEITPDFKAIRARLNGRLKWLDDLDPKVSDLLRKHIEIEDPGIW